MKKGEKPSIGLLIALEAEKKKGKKKEKKKENMYAEMASEILKAIEDEDAEGLGMHLKNFVKACMLKNEKEYD